MGKETASKPAGVSRPVISLQSGAQVAALAFYFLFLVQCTLLPLVGKAAMQGSYSPGAERAIWAGANTLFFSVMLVLMLAVGMAAFVLQLRLRKAQGTPISRAVCVLLAAAGLMAIGLLTGAFGI